MNATILHRGRNVTFYDLPDPRGHLDNCLLHVGWYELPNLEFIRGLHIEGNYVDVGAYIGTHSLYFSLFCPAHHVYAFEPQITPYNRLVNNFERNGIGNYTAYHTALLDRPDAVMNPNDGEIFPVTTMDAINPPDIKLIKIDTESTELEVLQGARETLRTVDHVFLEIWPRVTCAERNRPYSLELICEFLRPYGLSVQGQLPWEDLWYFAKQDKRAEVQACWRATHGDRLP